MALEKYNEKRDFDKTPEPAGEVASAGDALRFVVQKHAASRLHFDFRLEWEGVLLSWAVPKGPSFNSKDRRLAVHVEDHPLDYSNFEGTIPKGEYGGGTVMVWDQGTWVPDGDVAEGMKSGSLKFELHGERLKGRWTLVRMKPKPGEEDKNWLLIKEKDDYVRADIEVDKFLTSIVSGRTMEEIASGADAKFLTEVQEAADSEPEKEREGGFDTGVKNLGEVQEPGGDLLSGSLPFQEAEIMLAKLAEKAPAGDGWIHEVKFDGYRVICFLEEGKARLITRSGLDWTHRFPHIAVALEGWNPGNVVLDGEIVVLTEPGKSDFQGLQAALKAPDEAEMHYIVFDCLALGAEDIRNEPLLTRKALLKELTKTTPAEILYNFHQVGSGQQVFDNICSQQQEGIISKRADSVYRAGRGDDWLKVKCEVRQEFVIGGFTTTEKSATGLSALLLGVNTEEGLTYVGRAGTGFSADAAADLVRRFKRLERKTSPFTVDVDERRNETITYVTPSLVAEIRYAEMTEDGLLRQASFKGLREDKPAKDVVLEESASVPDSEVMGGGAVKDSDESAKDGEKRSGGRAKGDGSPHYAGVKLSSPEKVMYPEDGISKKDIADYYWAVREFMLPYVVDRPMTLVRCTDGIGGECFFQKHMNHAIPGMDTFPFKEKDGEEAEAMVIRNAEGLMGAVQMGAVEFHSWGSATEYLEEPDLLVFDLDPDEGMEVGAVRQAVRDLKEVLDAAGLDSFLKTSGGKGYHVVVPLEPAVKWGKARDFAKLIAQTMEAKWAERYTANMRKANRKGRVYIDWVRNGRGATSVCSFSLRSRKGAPVSWPLRWEDLDEVLPNEVTLRNYETYLETLEGWENFGGQGQRLK